jgi:arginyl-tRNA synthetase
MSEPLNPFAAAAARQVAETLGLSADRFQVAQPPRPDLGDFAVGCFPAARTLKKAPPALAAEVAAAFAPGEHLREATAAGPFVNFRADRPALFAHLLSAGLSEGGARLVPAVGAGKTICIDYSSPNISKHLAYHHIRSTVIGRALVGMNRALGYRVIGINHLGDWGTTHGMLLAAYARWGPVEPLTVGALNDLYVRFRREMKEDRALEEEGRAWFARLESGDPEARALWQRFRDVSWAEFQSIYELLGVSFEEVRGESDYLDDMPAVLELLEERGLSAESEGALVVPLEEEGMPPLLLRKQDGATLYATRDLAAAIYRYETYRFERSLYVVDRGQSLHFQQLFRVLDKAGFAWASRCVHVPFGLVRIGGKKTGTRTGEVVLLREVLAEAQRRSRERIAEANPEIGADQLDEVARKVGVGAIVFANLASQRDKDVDFSWDEVLSFEGDAGPYVQYAHARSAAILRKAEVEADPAADAALLASDHEWQLGLRLADFPDAVARAARGDDPHVLSRYLLDLCATYSRWYTAGSQDPALRALTGDPALSRARVSLVAVTREVLRRGLDLLGIEAPDAM